jgi:drug/metabolite transporter (DMT)-like permease
MSNITLGVPVLGLVSSALILSEVLSAGLIGGVVLVVIGVVLSAVAIRRKAQQNALTAERARRLAKAAGTVG